MGTPKGRLTRYEKALTDLPWHKVRDGVDVKLLPQDNEVYILAQSRDRIHKERSMRRRQLKRLWKRLHELQEMELTRDQLLLKLGAAKQQSPSAWRFVKIDIPEEDGSFRFSSAQRQAANRQTPGGPLSPPHEPGRQGPGRDVGVLHPAGSRRRSIQKPERGPGSPADPSSEGRPHRSAHLRRLHGLRPSRDPATPSAQIWRPDLTPRAALEKFSAVQMIDVHLPTTDGRTVIMSRYTQPEPELQILLKQLRLSFPGQPPPRMTVKADLAEQNVVKTF